MSFGCQLCGPVPGFITSFFWMRSLISLYFRNVIVEPYECKIDNIHNYLARCLLQSLYITTLRFLLLEVEDKRVKVNPLHFRIGS